MWGSRKCVGPPVGHFTNFFAQLTKKVMHAEAPAWDAGKVWEKRNVTYSKIQSRAVFSPTSLCQIRCCFANYVNMMSVGNASRCAKTTCGLKSIWEKSVKGTKRNCNKWKWKNNEMEFSNKTDLMGPSRSSFQRLSPKALLLFRPIGHVDTWKAVHSCLTSAGLTQEWDEGDKAHKQYSSSCLLPACSPRRKIWLLLRREQLGVSWKSRSTGECCQSSGVTGLMEEEEEEEVEEKLPDVAVRGGGRGGDDSSPSGTVMGLYLLRQ